MSPSASKSRPEPDADSGDNSDPRVSDDERVVWALIGFIAVLLAAGLAAPDRWPLDPSIIAALMTGVTTIKLAQQ